MQGGFEAGGGGVGGDEGIVVVAVACGRRGRGRFGGHNVANSKNRASLNAK